MVLNERDNEIIPRHPLGFVVISMNPYSVEFAGTKPLNAAFRRRMSVWINFDYLSNGATVNENEVRLVHERCKVGEEVARQMIKAAAQLRFSYKKGDIPYAPSVGDIINWATLVADGTEVLTAAEETIITTTSDDVATQEQVRRIVKTAVGADAKPKTTVAESQ
jgi:nitric oxide reductase NorQ protein